MAQENVPQVLPVRCYDRREIKTPLEQRPLLCGQHLPLGLCRFGHKSLPNFCQWWCWLCFLGAALPCYA
jgi:hypothetical protein